MGNVLGSAAPSDTNEETEDWLQELHESRFLDMSRKVTHGQYLKHIQGEYTEASLKDIPWSILEYMNLYSRVDVSFNNIGQISSNLPLRIPHLTHLNLSYNSLVELPPSIALLFHLEELLLRNNQLVFLPEEICLLPKLLMLDVSFNQLRVLPKAIGKIESLARLNVSHNFLTSIPHSLGLCSNLCVLLASSNSCVEPPQDVCNSSVHLLVYLRNHAPEVLTFKQLNCFPRIRSNIARSQLDDTPRTQTMSSYVQTLTQTSKPASRAKTPLLLPASATRLNPEELRDRIIGLIYGAVLGDTIGVAVEYLTKDEIDFYYGDGRLDHQAIVQDEHRSHFQRGKTTCVSELMLLIFESIIQWSGVLDELELARRLVEYSCRGFKDLNSHAFITSSVINRLCSNEKFPVDPHQVAWETANLMQGTIHEDLYALPIAIMSGLPQFYNLSEVQSNAARVCRTTHNDERIVRATIVLSSIVALILQGQGVKDISSVIDKDLPTKETADTACERRAVMKSELDRVIEAAVNCLDEESNFEVTLTRVLFRGGESRIYGGVCGGILGCLSGYTRLPARWLDGLHPTLVNWLNERLNHLLDMMGLP